MTKLRSMVRGLIAMAVMPLAIGCAADAYEPGSDEPLGEAQQAICNSDGYCDAMEDCNCGDCPACPPENNCTDDGYCDLLEAMYDCADCKQPDPPPADPKPDPPPPDPKPEPPPPTEYCGDGKCSTSNFEDCSWCPADCKTGCEEPPPAADPCDYDGFCDSGEKEATCSDCKSNPHTSPCGDNICDSFGGEDCWSCPADCTTCCGNGQCDGNETATSCPQDCGSTGPNPAKCGDSVCNSSVGEDHLTCPQDCGTGNSDPPGEPCCTDSIDSCGWKSNGKCDPGCNWGIDPECSTGQDCCGDASDPCKWKGDGFCNQGCAWGIDPDCAGNNGNGNGNTSCGSGQCQCGSFVPPVAGTLEFEQNFTPVSASCPVVGGNISVEIGAKGSGSYEPATCPDFTSKFSAGGEAKGTVDLCGIGFGVKAKGGYTSEKKYESSCNQNSCEYEASSAYCATSGWTGSGEVFVSRTFGFKKSWSSPGGSILPSYGINADCGIKATGSISANVSHDGTENGGGSSCTSCKKIKGNVGLKLTGEGTCQVSAYVGSFSTNIGCQSCGKVEVEGTVGHEAQSGQCGNQGCTTGSIGVSAEVGPPCFTVKVGWYERAVECNAKASAKQNFSSCGGGGLETGPVEFTCGVKKSCN